MKTNDPLAINYPVRIREVILSILIILSLLFYLRPKFLEEIKAEAQDEGEEIETIIIPPTEILEQQKPLKPAIPVPEDDEFFEEEIEFQDTDFDSWDDWDAPDASSGPNIKFVPFDKAPVPKRGREVRPIYPEIAKEAGIEGTVYVLAFIDVNGNVTDTQIQKGVPNTGLDEAAESAVKASKWKPARQREKKVGVWITIPVRFELK